MFIYKGNEYEGYNDNLDDLISLEHLSNNEKYEVLRKRMELLCEEQKYNKSPELKHRIMATKLLMYKLGRFKEVD